MGILNLTPDSFYDGGRYNSIKQALFRVEQMLLNNAKIIDIGGVSTKPNAKEVSEKEELNRVLDVIKELRKNFPNTLISIDTYRASVALAAIDNGANIVNDISGGTIDKEMFNSIAKVKCPYILTHIQGTPKNMQTNPNYKNVLQEVILDLSTKKALLEKNGVFDIIIDPGFGFGKTIDHNFELLSNLNVLKEVLEVPIMVGISRKSMLYKLLDISPKESLPATITSNLIALSKGVSIIRVHDVKEANEMLCIYKKVLQS